MAELGFRTRPGSLTSASSIIKPHGFLRRLTITTMLSSTGKVEHSVGKTARNRGVHRSPYRSLKKIIILGNTGTLQVQ